MLFRSFGDIDKLLPKRDGKTPFALPDVTVDVNDARMRIESQWGQIGARIDGKGNLANGFASKVAAIAPALKIAGCEAQHSSAYLDVVVRNRAPTLNGPVRADVVRCASIAAQR